MFQRFPRLRMIMTCALLEFGLVAGLPMRPDEIVRLLRWASQPRLEQTLPDEAAQGDGQE